MAWLSGYTYRKQITIDGTTDGAQTNYQMKLTVHKGSGSDSADDVYLNNHCQDDFDDIRFTRSDGDTELDHWRQEYVSGDYAVFWIEFDSIPASPNSASFYIYYGNAGASSASDGETTFRFFDDFPGDALDTDKWDTLGSPTITVADSAVKLDKTESSSGVSHGITTKTFTCDNARIISRAKAKAAQSNTLAYALAQYNSRLSINGILFKEDGSTTLRGDTRDDGGSFSDAEINASYVADTYYAFYFTRADSTHIKAWENGIYKCEVTSNIKDADLPVSAQLQFWGNVSRTNYIYVDWIAVANYTGTEPTWDTWGTEEQSAPAAGRSFGFITG